MHHSTVRLSDFVSHLVFKNTQIKQILQTCQLSPVWWWPPNERQQKTSQCQSCP